MRRSCGLSALERMRRLQLLTAMGRPSLRTLARQPGYAALFAGGTLARLADEMFSVAVVVLVLERTGSAALAGATVAAVTLPSLVSGPLLGAWIDLTGRRRRLLVLDRLLIGAGLISLLALTDAVPGWVLPLLVLPAGLTYPLSFGGLASMIPVLVPEDLLAPANAAEASSMNGALVIGPALAGVISGLAGPEAALITEAVLTLAAIPLILRIPSLDSGRGRSGRTLLDTAAAGLRRLVAVPALRGVTATGVVSLAGFGLLTVAFPLFAAGGLGAQESAAGYLWAAFAVGSTAGALALVPLQARWPAETVVFAGTLLLGLLMLVWPLAPSLPVALALIGLTGLADGPALAATYAVRQRHAPRSLYGQVFTTAASLKIGAFGTGAALAGPAVLALGARGTLVLAAALQFAAVALGMALMRLRRDEQGRR